jgi:phosphopantetheine adenylyltransferase
MKKPTKEKSINFSMKEKDPTKYVDIEPTLNDQIKEAKSKIGVITFGRFNPITIGHEKLVNKVVSVSKSVGGVPEIYASHSQDAKKNPLSYDQKISFMKIAFGAIVKTSTARTIIELAKQLSGKYDDLIVVGADRVTEFETLLNNYNGKEYNFNSIKVVSAGDRDPDADDVSGMSASKMRKLAADKNESGFKAGLPKRLKVYYKDVYDAVLKGMKLMEEFDDESEDLSEGTPLTLQQRRRRGLIMRRYAGRMKVARERAKRRKASPEKLKKRAQRKALNLIRQRLMKQKQYASMSAPEKIALDKRLARVPVSAIARIARKELPKVRQAEMQRLADLNKSKKESFDGDINSLFEQFVNEPSTPRKKKFSYLFTREGKVNCDRRYKMYRPKNRMIESLENMKEDLFDLIESTESFIESLDKTDPKNREYGTDSLVKILKKDTPGEKLDEVKLVPPLKHAKTTVPDFVEPATPDISVNVSKHNKHHLGIGLNLKQMMQHALKARDVDNDGDVDAQDAKVVGDGELVGDPSFDKTKTPGEATTKMKRKYEKEKAHTKVGLAFENYYAGLSKSTAEKRRAHFNKGAKMDDDDPAAYDPAPGDARAKTKPSIHTKRFKALYGEEADMEESYTELSNLKNRIAKNEKKMKSLPDLHPVKKQLTMSIAKDKKKHDDLFKKQFKEDTQVDESSSAETSLKDKAEKTGISYSILKKVYDRGVAAWRTGHRPGTTPSQWGHARVNSFSTGGKTRQTADADLWKQHSGKNEELDLDFSNLDESAILDRILNAARNHVLKGEDLMDISWNISQLAGVNMPPKKIYDMYVSKYGKPSKETIDKSHSKSLRLKYGLASENKARGFECKMVDVPNVPVRMIDRKTKSFPSGKSSSSKGGNGD